MSLTPILDRLADLTVRIPAELDRLEAELATAERWSRWWHNLARRQRAEIAKLAAGHDPYAEEER